MTNEDFFTKINHYKDKLDLIAKLKDLNELSVSFDRLSNEKEVEQELLYFKCGNECNCENQERKGLFIFSHEYFFKELNDKEFKRMLGKNMLNLLIIDAYKKIEKNNKAKINDIIENISKNNKNLSFISRSKILKRILSLSYYHNWDLEKDKDSIDSNYLITIPDDFGKVKQRFNLDIMLDIIEDENYLFFLNAKGDLCLVLKNITNFGKKEIIQALKRIQKEFNIKNINYVE